MKKFWIAAILLVLVAFAIPVEHKYDKLFRFFSLKLIPNGLELSKSWDKKIYFYVSDLIALALLPIGLIWFQIPFKRFFGHPLWVVFFCATASILISPFFHYPVAYTRLLQLLTPIILFSFLKNAFTEEEKPKVTQFILMALVAAGLGQTVIGIIQYFHQAPLGLRFLGENSIMSTVPIADGCRWTFDRIFHHVSPNAHIYRAAGTIPHTNVFGGFLVVSILSTYFLATSKRVLAYTLPFQFFAMCLSYSRAALFAWALGTVVFFIQKRDQFLALMIGLSVLISAFLLHEQYINRGGVVNYNAVAQNSDAVRLFHQKTAFDIIRAVPFLGLGFGQFSERALSFFPAETHPYVSATGPHNIYLFLACETGLISLFSFLLFIALILWGFLKSARTLETATLSSIFIAFLFIGCCDFYPLLFQQGKLMFFITAGLLAAQPRRELAYA